MKKTKQIGNGVIKRGVNVCNEEGDCASRDDGMNRVGRKRAREQGEGNEVR
jgi:hypothetical protein